MKFSNDEIEVTKMGHFNVRKIYKHCWNAKQAVGLHYSSAVHMQIPSELNASLASHYNHSILSLTLGCYASHANSKYLKHHT